MFYDFHISLEEIKNNLEYKYCPTINAIKIICPEKEKININSENEKKIIKKK